jgi:hypothetical protein
MRRRLKKLSSKSNTQQQPDDNHAAFSGFFASPVPFSNGLILITLFFRYLSNIFILEISHCKIKFKKKANTLKYANMIKDFEHRTII